MPSSPPFATGTIAILDLPKNTTLGIDGHPLTLRRDDFIGIDQIPSHHPFHLVTVRSGGELRLTFGFVILPQEGMDWIVARRYDPQTEEVASSAVDIVSSTNLLGQIRSGQLGPQRVIPFPRILSSTYLESWQTQTEFITKQFLESRGVRHGDKIVPGSYRDEVDLPGGASTDTTDGNSVVYPPLPFLCDSNAFRRTSHPGTKCYLARLSPSDRTALFQSEHPADLALKNVLESYYSRNWDYLLGDLQFAYVLFLHLHCFSSLEHWRDLIAMVSLGSEAFVIQHPELYAGVLRVLSVQLTTMETDFFEDIEYASDNFFTPAINRLRFVCSPVVCEKIQSNLSTLNIEILDRFADSFNCIDLTLVPTGVQQHDRGLVEFHDERKIQTYSSGKQSMEDEGDSQDGPVVVSSDDVEASFARSSQYGRAEFHHVEYPREIREKFPLLFASMTPQEDILMTCARVLDDAVDVSLVREAADYLEETEANQETINVE